MKLVRWVLPLGVLLLTFASAWHIHQASGTKDRLRFQFACERILEGISSRMATYVAALRGTGGFFSGSEYVSHDEFMTFARELRLNEEYPGMQALGFSTIVRREDRQAVLERMRSSEHESEFHFFPETDDSETHAILYLHPPTQMNRGAIGYNMFSEPTRRAAMELARDTGAPNVTGPVTLIQDTGPDRQSGFLLYLPVYRGGTTPLSVEERRAQLIGFVYGAFRADDLFQETIHEGRDPRLDFTVIDGDTVLHSSDKFHSPLPDGYVSRFAERDDVKFAGRTWTVAFAARPQFEATAEGRAEIWILLSGLLATAVLVATARVSDVAAGRVAYSEAQRRETVTQLEQSDERYRRFIEQSTEGIWRVEFESPIDTKRPVGEQVRAIFETGRFAECNDAMAKMFGRENAAEVIGLRVGELLNPGDEADNEFIAQFIEAGYVLADVITARMEPAGEKRFISNNLFGVVERQQLCRAWGTRRDVTEGKNAEEALLVSQQRLQAMVDSSEDAIITKSLDGTVLSWNPSAERIFGFKPEEIVGQSILNIVPDNRREEEYEILRKIGRGERVSHLETERRTKSGRTIYISVSSSPMKDKTGRVFGAAKIARDITDQKVAARALEESEARFKALAEERNRLLEQERAARAEIDRANRIKDDFLLTLSHELRTPLNAILGWSQLFARKKLDAGQLQEGLAVIERNARSQAQIIDDLLDMNRIVSGKVRLEMEPVDLRAVIQSAMDTVNPAAHAKEIAIQTRFEHEDTKTVGDAARLTQVFWNLLSNAVKFTPKGGLIEIVFRRVGGEIKIQVRDTGDGIKPEFLPYVFDRFRQADSSTTRRQGGLGLGLNIVKQLVELHGGGVSADSSGSGQGSVFTIALPLLSANTRTNSDRALPIDEPAGGEPTHPSVDLRGRRILVVDDEADSRELMRITLVDYGAEVFLAASSREAMGILEAGTVDLILSDIGMPEEDGYGFIRRVRRLPRDRGGQTPAIAVTAFARREDRIHSIAAGFQMHVAKPVEPAELLAAVGSIAAGQK